MSFYYQWIYWPVIVLFTIACGVWAAILIGSVSGSLAHQGRLARILALKPAHADEIMKAATKPLAPILAALGILVIAVVQTLSVEDAYERQVSNLLSQVRGDDTPQAIVQSIETLAEIPGSLRRTLQAYNVFLKDPRNPDVHLIERTLGNNEEQSVLNLRLLGLGKHKVSVRLRSLQQFEPSERMLDEAAAAYMKAKTLAEKDDFSGDPDNQSKTLLVCMLNHSLATISLSRAHSDIAKHGTLTPNARKRLEEAIKGFSLLVASPGTIPHSYVNLMATYSVLEKYDDALKILASVRKSSLREPDRQLLKRWVSDYTAQDLDELAPLANYVKRTKGMEWHAYVESTLGADDSIQSK